MTRIILVDDQRGVDEIWSRLEASGIKVEAFNKIDAAERTASQDGYELIISGHHMPGMNGLEFLKRLRSSGNEIPFILFTAQKDMGVVTEALNHGATSYVVRKGDAGTDFIELKKQMEMALVHGREERERETTIEFLRQANEKDNLKDLIHFAVTFFHKRSGCEALGIRLRSDIDFPYYETFGFSADFIRTERTLCSYDDKGQVMRDQTGEVLLDCMCGNILQGRFDPSKPFFTKKGSFCSNCTTRLLASTTEKDRQARTRNRCNGEGYESVALLPLIHAGERIGLLQMNDRRENMFTPESISLWERLADYLAMEIAKFQSIENLRKAKEALRASEERMRVIAESSPDNVIVQDSDLRYLWVLNPQLGLTEEDMLGRTDFDLAMRMEDAERLTEVKTEVMRSDKEAHITIAIPGKNGLEHFDGSLVPRHDAAGNVDGIIGYFKNVTATMQTQEALREMSRKLNILSSITRHDINNQLLILSGNLDVLMAEDPSLAGNQLLMRSLKATERIGAMVNFTRAYESIGVLEPEWQDVALLTHEAAKEIDLGNVRLVCDVPPGVQILADALLSKVFLNLLQNSLLHGKTLTTIRVSVIDDAVDPAIVFEDDGVGIPPESRSELFTHKPGRDHGLGLFLCREVLDITGITITENGEPGKGARFVLEVPRNGFRRTA
jgi:PAS domain S-box-containing protein